jgi:thiamine biosynthesis lipoprotein
MRVLARWCPGLAAAVLAACGGCDPVVHGFGGPTMGSTYEVKFVGDHAIAAVEAAVEEELERFDRAFSNWRDDSEIARCNRHAGAEPFAASPLFAAVLRQALEIAERTGGAFDPTVKPLLDVYRAAKADPEHRLDEAALAAARERVGHGAVTVRDGAVHKARAAVQLDLDGIVAGACIDAIAARLDALGVRGYYLQVTGEVFCRGEKAPGQPWIIGVVDPAADAAGGDVAIAELPLRDRALCTSGDYRNAVGTARGVVHHIFDPRTGANPRHGVVSVSVLAPTAALADALGTAFLVLGDVESRALLERTAGFGEIGALFLLAAGDGPLRRVEWRWPR